MTTVLVVAVGAAVGAPLRYWTDRWVRRGHDTLFPWGTLSVNVVASLVLGILAGATARTSPATAMLIGTGFCGALSTYSTFAYETQQLVRDRAWFYAGMNVVLSLVAGIGAAALGWTLGATVG